MYRVPELLAPVGGPEQLKAAVENGADAIYMGTNLFNARMNADNFTLDTLEEAAKYAHIRGVSVHVAMNTLIADGEMEKALEEAVAVYEAGADALIIQDLGFATMLKRHFPEIELHLSTQGTVYNVEGVEQAAKMGFSRVVLARELSLKEIGAIAAKKAAEIEVFIHGALCICYSGQCQMSRLIGGRSGNRGECAQPCRLEYELYKENRRKQNMVFTGRRGFLLSSKDIRTIDHVGKLATFGVDSLKIEGRMKSPEYVALVTGIYRKYLDRYAERGEYKVEEKDRLILNQIFNRGAFTEGYLNGNPRRGLLSGELPKHQGVEIGKVLSYNKKKRTLEAELWLPRGSQGQDPLSLGDGIEIRNKELPGNIITYIKGREIGYLSGTISPGDRIYKITDRTLIEEARVSYEGKSGKSRKGQRKRPIDMKFTAFVGQPVELTIVDGARQTKVDIDAPDNKEERLSVTVCSENSPQQALTKALEEDVIKAQLEKTGETPFRLRRLNIELDQEPISFRISLINDLRRRALEQFESVWIKEHGRAGALGQERIVKAHEELKELRKARERDKEGTTENSTNPKVSYYLFSAGKEALERALTETYFIPEIGSLPVSRYYLPYEVFLEEDYREGLRRLRGEGKEVIPVLPPVTKGREDAFLRANLARLLSVAEENGISIGNLGHLSMFLGRGIEIYGDYGLNFYNRGDLRLAKELGLRGTALSGEFFLPVDGVEKIARFENLARELDLELEIAVEGTFPLMISAHCSVGDMDDRCRGAGSGNANCICDNGKFYIKDRKNKYYPILTRKNDCQMLLFSDKREIDREYVGKGVLKKASNLRIYGIDEKIFCGGTAT